MSRTVIDLDDEQVEELMKLYGTRTKAETIRRAVTEEIKHFRRIAFMDAIDSGEIDLTYDSRTA
ncbi:type II toxin-antitoxin system VapB family antitoxin [Nocardiopsis sp. NPDC050513]|uniref:type II toxin-antitoxin system VapB family antitoxin n=1 Tax=Nocardiopsis sp. NPDC050513 TaxID=3364338 RepID=UPI0037B3E206